MTFEEEFRLFLKRYRVAYDERCLELAQSLKRTFSACRF